VFTLDTNILIYNAANDKAVISFFEDNSRAVFYVPSVVVTEFLSFKLIRPDDVRTFEKFVASTVLINLDFLIAELAAKIKRDHGLKLGDSIIAASSLFTGSTLVTRNVSDFKKVKNLQLLKI